MDFSPPGSSVHGILQVRILEWVAMPSPGDLLTQGSNPDLLQCRWTLYQLSHQGSLNPADSNWTPMLRAAVLVTQSCLTLCNCIPPVSSAHGILQARMLEWVAIPSYRGSSQPRDQTHVSCIAGRFFTVWATRKAWELQYQAKMYK